MPTYDYECDACGHKFEHFQSITSEVLTKCPECKKKKLRRLFGTGGGLLFKGSGFYKTDYRSDSYSKAAKADSGSSSSSSESKSSEANHPRASHRQRKIPVLNLSASISSGRARALR